MNFPHVFLKLILLYCGARQNHNNKLEVNAGFGKTNTELSAKLTAEIKKINSRDAGYASGAQKILSM